MRSTARSADIDHDEHAPQARFGLLLYGGREVLPPKERILAVPFAVLFGASAN